MWQRFEVERYLEYHGVKLARRFDTNSYLAIGKAMDLHDVARGRGSLDRAMLRVVAPTMAVGISSDMLYPAYQQQQIHEAVAVFQKLRRTRSIVPLSPMPSINPMLKWYMADVK